MSAIAFHFETPASFWLEKSAPAGRRRRIGGLISTETRDKQDEVVLQRGLDLEPFATHGYFNDNHDKTAPGIVGYPDAGNIFMVEKGDHLRNGQIAPAR